MNRITDLKRNKFWFEQETGLVYTRFWNTCTTQENSLKQWPGEKKLKQWHIYHLARATIPGMDRCEILIPSSDM